MKTPIIDPHVHMDTRSANDYELMAVSGVEAVVVPSTYTGEKRNSPEAYFQYYDRLLGLERRRAAHFGIKLFAAVSIDPEALDDVGAARATIEALPRYFEREGVCAVGEVGLETFTPDEVAIFREQLALANAYRMPAILHTPHHDKAANLPRMVEILARTIDDCHLDRELILLDDLSVDTFGYAWDLQLGAYGIAVSPRLNGLFVVHRKATPEEAKAILDEYGSDRIVFNTALAWGYGDAMAIARTLLHLRMMGVPEDVLHKAAYANARRFLTQCARFSLEEPAKAETLA